MTKWFDTNYHYLVPEIGPETDVRARPDQAARASSHRRAATASRPGRYIVGPVTFLLLSKASDDAPAGFARCPASTTSCRSTPSCSQARRRRRQLGPARRAGPGRRPDTPREIDALPARAYDVLGRLRPAARSCSSPPTTARSATRQPALAATGIERPHSTSSRAPTRPPRRWPAWATRPWSPASWTATTSGATTCEPRAGQARRAAGLGRHAGGVSTSTSTLHVPHDVDEETQLTDAAAQLAGVRRPEGREVVTLAPALRDGAATVRRAAIAAIRARRRRRERPRRTTPTSGPAPDRSPRPTSPRGPRPSKPRQEARLHLPPLPTTTIGSFPQTAAIRSARAALRDGRASTTSEYEQLMQDEIATSSRCRKSSGSTCWCTASPSATTWCSTSPRTSTASPSRQRLGPVLRHRAACARRSSGATSPAPPR